jgi:hypothetical protein
MHVQIREDTKHARSMVVRPFGAAASDENMVGRLSGVSLVRVDM